MWAFRIVEIYIVISFWFSFAKIKTLKHEQHQDMTLEEFTEWRSLLNRYINILFFAFPLIAGPIFFSEIKYYLMGTGIIERPWIYGPMEGTLTGILGMTFVGIFFLLLVPLFGKAALIKTRYRLSSIQSGCQVAQLMMFFTHYFTKELEARLKEVYKAGDFDEIQALLYQLNGIDKVPPFWTHHLQAIVDAFSGNYDDSLAELEEINDPDREFFVAWVKAWNYEQMKRYEDAIKEISGLLKLYPGQEPLILSKLRHNQFHLGNMETADNLYDQLLANHPDDRITMAENSWVAYHQGEYKTAMELIDRLYGQSEASGKDTDEQHSTKNSATSYHALIYIEQQQYEKSIELINQLIKDDPIELDYWNHLALLEIILGKFDSARRNCVVGLVQCAAGDIANDLGYDIKGIKNHNPRKDITICNHASSLLTALSSIELNCGFQDLALKLGDSAIEMDPYNTEAYCSRANAHLELGQEQAALEDVLLGCNVDPYSFDINLLLAYIQYFDNKLVSSAIPDIESHFAETLKRLQAKHLAYPCFHGFAFPYGALLDMIEPGKGLEYLKIANDAHPAWPDYALSYAKSLAATGDIHAAYEVIEKADISPDLTWITYLYSTYLKTRSRDMLQLAERVHEIMDPENKFEKWTAPLVLEVIKIRNQLD